MAVYNLPDVPEARRVSDTHIAVGGQVFSDYQLADEQIDYWAAHLARRVKARALLDAEKAKATTEAEKLGRFAYDTYFAYFAPHTGKSKWDLMPQSFRDKWIAAAQAVRDAG